MSRRAEGLTAAQVEKGTKCGRYGDGAGLDVLVRSRETKFWFSGDPFIVGTAEAADALREFAFWRTPGYSQGRRT